MSDLGYNSFNPIINLGTLWVLLLLYIFKVTVTLAVLWPISRYYGKVMAMFKRAWNEIFFGEFLVIIVEGYLEFLIVSFLVYQAPDGSQDKTPFLLGFGCVCFAISNGLVPLLIIYHLSFYSLEKMQS